MRISDTLFAQLYPRNQVLLNPTVEQVLVALRTVQAGCRKNLLSADSARKLWSRVMSNGELSAVDGLRRCPGHFSFGIDTTVMQVLRIEDGLIGCIVCRTRVEPGEEAVAPVSDPVLHEAPSRWLNQIVSAFWNKLDDATMARLNGRVIAAVMRENAAFAWMSAHGHGGNHAAVRRQLQLERLFRNSTPAYTSELAETLRGIATEMIDDAVDKLPWREF